MTLAPREGSFEPWWKLLSIEVYGATKPATGATVSALNGPAGSKVSTAFDAEHHRITALVDDDAKGLELELTY